MCIYSACSFKPGSDALNIWACAKEVNELHRQMFCFKADEIAVNIYLPFLNSWSAELLFAMLTVSGASFVFIHLSSEVGKMIQMIY